MQLDEFGKWMRELSALQFLFFSLRLKSRSKGKGRVHGSVRQPTETRVLRLSLHLASPFSTQLSTATAVSDTPMLRAWVWSSHPPRDSQCTSTNSDANLLSPPPSLSLFLFFQCDGHRNHKICYCIKFLIRQSNNKYIWLNQSTSDASVEEILLKF